MRMRVTAMLPVLHTGSAFAQTSTIAPAPAASAQPAPEASMHATWSAVADSKAECIKMWDAGTHMTKQQCANTCARIQTRLENLKLENLEITGVGLRRKPGGKLGRIDPRAPRGLSLAAAAPRRIP
jgi:hypothetical protein